MPQKDLQDTVGLKGLKTGGASWGQAGSRVWHREEESPAWSGSGTSKASPDLSQEPQAAHGSDAPPDPPPKPV